MRHLIDALTDLDKWGIGFRSLTEHINATAPGDRLVFHIFGSIAEFERDLISRAHQRWVCSAGAGPQGRQTACQGVL